MKLPDGPDLLPELQLFTWIIDPLAFLDRYARSYGDIFIARWRRFAPFVIVSNPDYVQQIFSGDTKLFDSGKGGKILEPLMGQNSLLLLDGVTHQRHRKLMMPPFHGERLRTYGETIVTITKQVLQSVHHHKVPMRSVTQAISLRTILQVIFGLYHGPRYEALETYLKELLHLTDSPLRASVLFLEFLQRDWGHWSPWGKFLYLRQGIDRLLQEEITDRQQREPGSDILSLLIGARDEEGSAMTFQELRDELITLLIAGHETTASSLVWSLYLLYRHPAILTKLREEISHCSTTDIDEIGKLPYLAALCQETLRIHPIAILTEPRIPREPFTLGEYTIPQGYMIAPSIHLIHHRSDIYPEPQAFRPERFLEKQFTPYEYFPFGGGGRRCIGAAFALWEMKLALFTFLKDYDYKVIPDRPVRPSRRGVTVGPPADLSMEIWPLSP